MFSRPSMEAFGDATMMAYDSKLTAQGVSPMGTGKNRIVIALSEEQNECVARVYLEEPGGNARLLATARGSSAYAKQASLLFAREWTGARESGVVPTAPSLRAARQAPDSERRPIASLAWGSRRPRQ